MAFGALWGHPALAADRAVTVNDNFFAAARVGVKAGESVTWTATGAGSHNVTFDDGQLSQPSPPRRGPWTVGRTFQGDGIYRYYCQNHGGPGGVGMSGIVYVNAAANAAPQAVLTLSTSLARVGQTVNFSATSSLDWDGTIARYEWDLDGNGSFETDTGASATAARSYATSGAFSVKVRVTDNIGGTEEATRSLVVNTTPTASFTATPNPARAGEPVGFDASGSRDREGAIARHEWDLDGNGSYETDTGASPTASRVYGAPTTLTVGLRVSDELGARAQTARSLQVDPGSLAALAAPPPPSFAASRRSMVVSRNGRFSYSFGARPGLAGSMRLRSVARVRTSAKRYIRLRTKRFRVPASGVVKLAWKLSGPQLRILKRRGRIRFRASASLRSAAGMVSAGATTITLRKPR